MSELKNKRKSTGIILSIFINYFAWIYTWKYDKSKFWASLIITFLFSFNTKLFFISLLGTYLWCLIDMIIKKNELFDNYESYEHKTNFKFSSSIKALNANKGDKPPIKTSTSIIIALLLIFLLFQGYSIITKNNLLSTENINSTSNKITKIYSGYEIDYVDYVKIPSKIDSTLSLDNENIILNKAETPDSLILYTIEIKNSNLQYRIKLPSKINNNIKYILDVQGNKNYIELENSKYLDYLNSEGNHNFVSFDNENFFMKFMDASLTEYFDNGNELDCCWDGN